MHCTISDAPSASMSLVELHLRTRYYETLDQDSLREPRPHASTTTTAAAGSNRANLQAILTEVFRILDDNEPDAMDMMGPQEHSRTRFGDDASTSSSV